MKQASLKRVGALATLLLSFGCAGESGGSTEPDGAKASPVTFQGSDGATCTCEPGPAGSDASTMSLACFQSQVSVCPATLEPPPIGVDIATLAPFVLTRHEGCGQTTFSFNGGTGGFTCVYDAESSNLIGASVWSDASAEPCQTATILGGVQDTCHAGSVCSLSSSDHSCKAACSPGTGIDCPAP